MILHTIIAAFTTRNILEKNQKSNLDRRKFINQKYNERSIINRYFK
jgi:hypothetical protein